MYIYFFFKNPQQLNPKLPKLNPLHVPPQGPAALEAEDDPKRQEQERSYELRHEPGLLL